MKTNYNTSHTSKMVSVFFLVMVSSAVALAQPRPQQSDDNSNAEQAFERLEAFMNVAEQSIRYTAPSDEYADLEKVWERLEVFANNCEREMLYRVPAEEEHSTEMASSETDQKNKPDESLNYSANITMAVK